MTKIIFVVLLLIAAVSAQDFDANAFCFSCLHYPGHRYLWPFAGDCHKFVQCFYFNLTSATGAVQNCPPLTFFHEGVLQCMPEGPVQCQDICQDDAVSAKRCYGVPGSCNTYFTCANTASYQFCCPTGTSFDESSCTCVTSDTCLDVCVQPTRPPTTETSPIIFDDHCIDSFGATLYPDPNNVAGYLNFDGETYTPQICAPGTQFSLQACRCDIPVDAIVTPDSICEVYFPFDSDFNDHSPSRFVGRKPDPNDPTNIDNNIYASGTGSLYLHPGQHLGIGVAGIKTYDFGNKASFCLFYQCQGQSTPDAARCTLEGNLLANTKNDLESECTVDFASLATDIFWSNVSFDRPLSSSVSQGPVNTESIGFNQICVVVDGVNILLYINNVLISTTPYTPDAHLRIAHCALVIGYGHRHGPFNGWIDEVLICRRPLSADEVAAHYGGQDTMRAANLIQYVSFAGENHE